MAARTAGSSMPDSERKTIEPLRPLPMPPKCSSSTSNPSRLSDSGASSCAKNEGPTTTAAANVTRTTATQAATVLRGLWKHQRATRTSIAILVCAREAVALWQVRKARLT